MYGEAASLSSQKSFANTSWRQLREAPLFTRYTRTRHKPNATAIPRGGTGDQPCPPTTRDTQGTHEMQHSTQNPAPRVLSLYDCDCSTFCEGGSFVSSLKAWISRATVRRSSDRWCRGRPTMRRGQCGLFVCVCLTKSGTFIGRRFLCTQSRPSHSLGDQTV